MSPGDTCDGAQRQPQPAHDPASATRNTFRSPLRCTRSWTGLRAQLLELHGPSRHLEDLRSDRPRLIVMLEQVGGRAEVRVAPDRPGGSRTHLTHLLAFLPPDTQAWQFAENFRYLRCIILDFDVELLAQRQEADVHTRFAPRWMFSDARLWSLASLIADECGEPQAINPTYRDSLALVMFQYLFRGAPARHGERTPSGLAPRQLQRVTERMEQSNTVPLKELALMSGLSVSHFGRAFKASTGMSPHRWLLHARVRRAQQVLLEADARLAEVALASGFADQSHLTRVFRSLTGEAPGAWRRKRRQ